MQALVIDGSTLITERIEDMLLTESKVSVVYKANDFKQGLNIITKKYPPIIILNSILYDNEVLLLLAKIKELKLDASIIMLLNNEDDFMIASYKMGGVKLFLDKYNDFLQIPQLINSIEQ